MDWYKPPDQIESEEFHSAKFCEVHDFDAGSAIGKKYFDSWAGF